jgi:hypothetical protein
MGFPKVYHNSGGDFNIQKYGFSGFRGVKGKRKGDDVSIVS